MQPNWAVNAIFYHIYPLGFCGAPQNNSHTSFAEPRLEKILSWIPHLKQMGINAIYLGPVFESNTHGYDTADYFWVDRRLGTNETLSQVSRELHANGIRLVLDGVFNHVGRDFWAFRDVIQNGPNSKYCDWFHGLKFDSSSPYGDPFTYDTWQGNYELVKLNLHNPQVREHLLEAVKSWIRDFQIDGLRLDTADCLDDNFQRELSAFTHNLRPDFWLMGEVIHGDYRHWTNSEMLDSVTNYEAYKGLYSSLADKNFFEIAFSLNRQFGMGGVYRDLLLYNFTDNHDVDRVASKLNNPALLYPLYCLLFSMPGIPSIYYGSEWGLKGARTNNSDQALRPCLDFSSLQNTPHQPELLGVIQRLSFIRQTSNALRSGSYQQLIVKNEQFAFARQADNQTVIVLINAAADTSIFELSDPILKGKRLVDLLNQHEVFETVDGRLNNSVNSHWARILLVEDGIA